MKDVAGISLHLTVERSLKDAARWAPLSITPRCDVADCGVQTHLIMRNGRESSFICADLYLHAQLVFNLDRARGQSANCHTVFFNNFFLYGF